MNNCPEITYPAATLGRSNHEVPNKQPTALFVPNRLYLFSSEEKKENKVRSF